MSKELNIKCPLCDKVFNYYSSKHRPFCREKCKMIDLGHWFNEEYTLKGEPSQKALEEIIDKYEEE